ncbi:hypothetical protein BUALT_Bualt04G0076500 [Buddleja alternifolia]|uniref:Protein gar2 n=1 Tax=Buddleja alternifolia TaxID=168488 RepID=A0AAV6XXY5_9LAMI|nr:hypothetical protein BUALT_Bualt04G0076500 [Buddleja alternifolia]
MVLSNKKLKQKVRAAKAELIAASEAQSNFTDKDSENSRISNSKTSTSVNILLNPEDQRPTLSKREKRRQKAGQEDSEIIKHREINGDPEAKKEDEMKSQDVDVKKKKRKRNETEASENVKEKKPEQLKKKKKTKKKKKAKKKAENRQAKEEGDEQNAGEDSGEQLAAKAYETTDREKKVPVVKNLNGGSILFSMAGKVICQSKQDVELSSRVYVGGIPYYSTEDDIRSYFESCGSITAVDCMTFPDTGKFRGIAMITFKTDAAAKRALTLDGSDMGGLFLKIQPFKSAKVNKQSNFSPAVLEGYNRVYIGNLSWDVTENDLRKLFSVCTITSVRFGEDKETGEFKGYAHVDFANNISLNVALKLDQTVVCGRPVRISCAVPKKGAVTQFKSMPRDDQVHSGEVPAVSAVSVDQVDSSAVNAVSAKIRRRTCYECGEKGHVSSSCPKAQAADVANPGASVQLKSMPKDYQVDYGEVPAVSVDQVDISAVNATSSKIRRRTCYECGEKGHVSSSCPKKQAADVATPAPAPAPAPAVQLKFLPKDDPFDFGKVPAVSAVSVDQVDSSAVKSLSSKIRRRTCYECGEKGHLSSSCPKIQAAELPNPGVV